MIRLLELSNNTLFVYYLLSNVFYLALVIVAFITAARHRQRLSSLRLETLDESPFTPPVSVLVPAHNEARTIVESVNALLALDYPSLQIVVINDGSNDNTLDVLEKSFALRQTSVLYVSQVQTAAVRGIYTSSAEPRLLVLDKIPGGTKADAANAGLNAATSPYVAVIDADSVLERDALLRLGAEIFSSDVEVTATGGIVRVLNGSTVQGGRIREIRLPRRGIEVLQVIEYLRAFLIGREAWGSLNMLPIISGAFGLFNRERLLRVGGFRANAIGEDIDLVVRMHRSLMEENRRYRLPFIPEPTCWTQVPNTLRALGNQRARWQKGLLDVLWKNRDMVFRRRYGRFGCVMLPYLWVFELAAPVVEVIGLSTIALAAILGALSQSFLIQFAIYGYAFATLISIGAVVQEEITFRRYHRWTDVARLLLYCLAEHCPYRQINMVWRLRGMWQYVRGNVSWEESERSAFAASAR